MMVQRYDIAIIYASEKGIILGRNVNVCNKGVILSFTPYIYIKGCAV